MKNYLVPLFYAIIFFAHILLLYWMIYVLKNAGIMTFTLVMKHFIGLAIFGGGLIIVTALGTKHIQRNEWKQKHLKK